MMTSLLGHFLVAPPSLKSADFAQTVILVIQHSQEQAVGLVVNRPSLRTVREAWGGKQRPACHQGVYSGGPVAGPLMALHTDQSLAEIEVLPGVYYSLQKKALEKLVRHAKCAFKLFDSHAGWGPGQLERWIEAGRWLILPCTPEQVYDSRPELWEEMIRSV